MYEVGKIYIWQNCRGRGAHLEGTETRVTSGPIRALTSVGPRYIQLTDTVDDGGFTVVALAGELRPKHIPAGERETMALFAEPMPPRSTSGDAKEKTADAMLAQLRRMLRFQRKGF
jgi:hypothetical protein